MKKLLAIALVLTGCVSTPQQPVVKRPVRTRLVPPIPGTSSELAFRAAAAPTFRAAAVEPEPVRQPPPETYHSPQVIGQEIPAPFTLELYTVTNSATSTLMLSTNLSAPWEQTLIFNATTNVITVIDMNFTSNPQRFFHLRPNL